MDTYEELCDRLLVHTDTLELIELLGVTPEELLERFEDKVELNRDEIEEYLDECLR